MADQLLRLIISLSTINLYGGQCLRLGFIEGQ